MTLRDLFGIDNDTIVTGISINSKEVEKGNIFICVNGVSVDRHDYVLEAINNGASSIVASKMIDVSVPVIYVDNCNKELPFIARKFYGYPDNDLDLIGITGTNGKTTVAEIISSMIGDTCGYLGTNGIKSSDFDEKIRNTTPDTDRLYKYFRMFVDSGCKYLSMEASSEAFYRHRLDNIKFKVGVVTNITEDHLNIHGSISNYVSCKKEILDHISEDGVAILNINDKYYQEFRDYSKCKVLTYGIGDADLEIVNIEENIDNTVFTFKYLDNLYTVKSKLLGKFNVYNLCGSILVLLFLGYDILDVISRVDRICAPEGRFELLDYGQDYKIVLDYAHTTDAFNSLFSSINKIKNGRVITVTGSAGGREKEKRPSMGKVVLDNSDLVIFTMDDPRYEDVNDIIDDLVSDSDKTNYERIIDRKDAIFRALSLAKKDDIVIIAGKGTDNYMAVEDKYLTYSDKEVIKEYFS